MDDLKPNQYDIRDPREEYSEPPFPRQEQDKPGLESEMTPRPDDGARTYKGLGRMKGRKALITGGDSGLGRAAAIAYMREGASVVINYMAEEEADARSLFALAEAEGGDITGIPGDLREEAFCERLVREAAERMGGLDALVLNAGYQIAQESIADLTTEQFDRTLKTNCYALFWLSKAALPLMPPGAAIINVSSTQGYDPSPGLLDYAATKFFIRGFTQAFAQQAIEKGVRVNAIAPGPFWTVLQPSHGQPMEKVMNFGKGSAMGRPGQPAELASTFVFLATQESAYMIGETIGATGGNPIA